MVAATNRKLYPLELKVRVLDDVAKTLEQSGEEGVAPVPPVARRHGLEPGLVYSWRSNEVAIRKAWKNEQKTAARSLKSKPSPVESFSEQARLHEAREKGTNPEPGAKEGRARHPKGPKLVTRGLGPWLEALIAEVLPPVVDERLTVVVEKKLEELERRLEERIDREIRHRLRGALRSLDE